MTVAELRSLLDQQPADRLVAVELPERNAESIEALHSFGVRADQRRLLRAPRGVQHERRRHVSRAARPASLRGVFSMPTLKVDHDAPAVMRAAGLAFLIGTLRADRAGLPPESRAELVAMCRDFAELLHADLLTAAAARERSG